MTTKTVRVNIAFIFLKSAGVVLVVTAIAKLISSFGTARILQNIDPVLGIPFRDELWIVGTIELTVSLICFFGKSYRLQSIIVTWLATSILVYRIGLVWIDYRKPCSCLGNLTDALHIPPQIADTAMKIILAYLLIGSYSTLFWLWLDKRKTTRLTRLTETIV